MRHNKGDKVMYIGNAPDIPKDEQTFVEYLHGIEDKACTIKDSAGIRRNVYNKNVVPVVTNNREGVKLLEKEY